jgi:hypothetical protein
MQKDELFLGLLAQARRLADAIYQCGSDYKQFSGELSQLNPEPKIKLTEAASSGIWAFEKYYENYSLKHYLHNYLNQQDNFPPNERIAELPAPTSIALCSAPIDLPVAVLAGALGFGAKLSADTLKLAGTAVVRLANKSDLNHYLFDSRSSHVGLLLIQDRAIRYELGKPTINARSLALICEAVLNDLKKLADCTFLTSINVGEGYMLQPITLQGLRHCITGRSRLAQLIEDSLINLFDFKAETEMLGLDQNFYLSPISNQPHNTVTHPYPKMRFFPVASSSCTVNSAQPNDNNANYKEERCNVSIL